MDVQNTFYGSTKLPYGFTIQQNSILEGQYYMNTEHETPKTTINKLDSHVAVE